MFRNPFDAPRAKIARSRTHFNELIAAQKTYSEQQPLEIELEIQPNGDTKAFAAIKTLPSLEHCTIVADIIGNFRSSLDLAVLEACRLRGQTDVKKLSKTYFAVGGSEQDWLNNLNNRMLGADDIIRKVVQQFKPWKDDGNELLYAMAKIVAKDKHEYLVPVAANTGTLSIDGLSAKREDGKASKFQTNIPKWGSTGKVELFTIGSPAKVEITGPSILKAIFGFGEVYALRGKPVVPALNQMGSICENIIDELEKVVGNSGR